MLRRVRREALVKIAARSAPTSWPRIGVRAWETSPAHSRRRCSSQRSDSGRRLQASSIRTGAAERRKTVRHPRTGDTKEPTMVASPSPAGAPVWAIAPYCPRRAGGIVSPSIACPAPQEPPTPRPTSARAARSQPKPGAKAQATLPSEKAAIDTAIARRRPSRSLIQPKRSPPMPVIPTPSARPQRVAHPAEEEPADAGHPHPHGGERREVPLGRPEGFLDGG